MLAIDLDGTLLDRKGRVSDVSRDAIARAREAGLRITICTGRGLVECQHVLDAIAQRESVVVAGGSIIANPATQRTEHRFAVDQQLVASAVEMLIANRHAALVLKDPLEAGFDYLVVHGRAKIPLDPVTLWWFDAMKCRVRYVESLDDDTHPEHTVRVGACGKTDDMARIKAELHAAANGSAIVHHFPAVVAPDSASKTPYGTLHVLELFDKNANKWSAIRVLAKRWEIDRARIAAIGDEINDLTMIEGAGLGIAMANAVPAVLTAAKQTTRTNQDDGVAHAIDMILAGEW